MYRKKTRIHLIISIKNINTCMIDSLFLRCKNNYKDFQTLKPIHRLKPYPERFQQNPGHHQGMGEQEEISRLMRF